MNLHNRAKLIVLLEEQLTFWKSMYEDKLGEGGFTWLTITERGSGINDDLVEKNSSTYIELIFSRISDLELFQAMTVRLLPSSVTFEVPDSEGPHMILSCGEKQLALDLADDDRVLIDSVADFVDGFTPDLEVETLDDLAGQARYSRISTLAMSLKKMDSLRHSGIDVRIMKALRDDIAKQLSVPVKNDRSQSHIMISISTLELVETLDTIEMASVIDSLSHLFEGDRSDLPELIIECGDFASHFNLSDYTKSSDEFLAGGLDKLICHVKVSKASGLILEMVSDYRQHNLSGGFAPFQVKYSGLNDENVAMFEVTDGASSKEIPVDRIDDPQALIIELVAWLVGKNINPSNWHNRTSELVEPVWQPQLGPFGRLYPGHTIFR